MENLLKETLKKLAEHNKKPQNVLWVGCKDFSFTWNDFEVLANRDYDDGYGGQEVAEDLLVVGDNWWLERHEYDGAEWWEYKIIPVKPDKYIIPNRVIRNRNNYESKLKGMVI